MTTEPTRSIDVSRAIAVGAAAYAFLGGLVSFLGWTLDAPRLADWLGTGIAIQPNTCIFLMAASASLMLFHARQRHVALTLGAMVAVAGLLTLLQHIVGRDFGFNRALTFGHLWGRGATVAPGLMGPPAAICLTLIGCSLVCLSGSSLLPEFERWRRRVSALGLAVCFLMMFSLVGYMVQAREFYALPWLSAIALQTASMLLCMGAALVASIPERQPMQLLLSRSGAATMARRVLPILVLAPPLLVWIRDRGLEHNWYDIGTGRALVTVGIVLLTVAIMWQTLRVVARQEEAQVASKLYLEETLDTLADGFVRIGPDWRFRYVNREGERLLLRREDLIGRRWQDVFPAAVGTDIDHAMQRVMRERVPVELESVYEPWQRWFRVKLYPMEDGGITSIFADITSEKRMQEVIRNSEIHLADELARRTDQVIRAERALARNERMAAVGTLASGLAHDINNIAMPLGLRMERMLRNPNVGEDVKTELAAVTALLEHLRSMAKNLSLFSRDPEQEGTEGHTDVASWWGGVEGLVASSLFSAEAGAKRRYIHLKGDIPPGLPPVQVAPHRLTQAVLNLVHNARDAIRAAQYNGAPDQEREGHITFEARARPDEGVLTLKVIDDGCGMPEGVMKRALEPFFTTKDRSGGPVRSGSGLGLALVHAICERSGGSLEIQSEEGAGTAITMILPVASEVEATSTRREGLS